ncbi:MAG TPA: MTH938/NDUFAF3 family protein [bacterium]|nr:MTH938/NDUFAF3 family protein [bacterium]HPQ20155.1 MTH938/NDUFAF3 family protein [bacterium]
MIKEYSFGKIIVNNKEYNYDIEVRSDGDVLKWWRKSGHFLVIDDLERAISKKPEIIIVGTGCYGVMEISEEVKTKLKNLNIKFIYDNTTKAVEIYNKFLFENKVIIGLFHLTC